MYKFQPKTLFIGQNLVFLPSCHSTNSFATQMLASGVVSEGTIVITPEQTAGRGQRGNVWQSQPYSNLTFSLILQPSFLNANEQFYLNMAIALAVLDCVTEFGLQQNSIKWSNDILVNNHKVCGMLIENQWQGFRLGNSVIGIGININQQHFDLPSATSFINEIKQETPLETVFDSLCLHLEKQYLALRNRHFSYLKTRYTTHLFRFQEKHWYKTADGLFEGQIIGVLPSGKLAIAIETGVRYFDFKEVSFEM